MTAIKERPILFSAPMVRAILDGRKTVTRRACKPQPSANAHTTSAEGSPMGAWWETGKHLNRCPFGQIGDRLYVRETCFINDFREAAVPVGERADCEVHYRADGVPDFEGEEELIRWRPSIHMPRWASRILLEITDVRVERLQDITYEQAAAEGVHRGPLREWCASDEGGACHKYPIPAFRDLWQSTGGDWDANPWVWVVEFKRVTP
ncbi:hypothetical protein [Pseudomonas sp. Sample_21]|uniref:hypothetical protein n=1 Tax=Pseudomonas sp. Sample_21 TaxID=2448265 RepID=UPI0010300B6C|nr:hypothetical protein [Pseudomonas sp. Sample_21]